MIIGGAVFLVMFLFFYFLYPMAFDYQSQNKKTFYKLEKEIEKLEQNIKQLKFEIAQTSRKIKVEEKKRSVLAKQFKEVDQVVSQLDAIQFNLQKWVQLLNFIADTTNITGLKFTKLQNTIYVTTKAKPKEAKGGIEAKLAKIRKKLKKKIKKKIKKVEVKVVKKLNGELPISHFLVKRLEMNITGSGPYKNLVDFVYNFEKLPDLVKVKEFSMDMNRTFTVGVEVYGFKK
jgi:hypothetical protein